MTLICQLLNIKCQLAIKCTSIWNDAVVLRLGLFYLFKQRCWMSLNLFLAQWKILGKYGVYMDVRRDLRGHFICIWFIHMPIQDISDTIIYRFYIEEGVYLIPYTFLLYRHLIRKHRWFSIAMKKEYPKHCIFVLMIS